MKIYCVALATDSSAQKGMNRVAPKLDLIWTPTSSDRRTPRELSHGLPDPVALPRRGREVGKHGHRGRSPATPTGAKLLLLPHGQRFRLRTCIMGQARSGLASFLYWSTADEDTRVIRFEVFWSVVGLSSPRISMHLWPSTPSAGRALVLRHDV